MDSITQLTLGAAIGEATLGRSVGRKAAAWGAALGTLPDLDVLSSPFVDDYTQLVLHRGFSHSVFFALAGGAAIAYGLAKLHAKFGVSFGRWFLFTFLALFTHALLDGFTVYGTQLLNPVSNFPFAWNSIFIIDPLYTVPLLLGLVVGASGGSPCCALDDGYPGGPQADSAVKAGLSGNRSVNRLSLMDIRNRP